MGMAENLSTLLSDYFSLSFERFQMFETIKDLEPLLLLLLEKAADEKSGSFLLLCLSQTDLAYNAWYSR